MNALFKATALAVLAEARLRAGDSAAALPLIERSLGLLDGGATNVTPHLAFVKSLKGIALLQGGMTQQALDWLRQSRSDFAAVLGPEHPLTTQCNLNIAMALFRSGQIQAAIDQWQAAEAALEPAFGPRSQAYAKILRAGRVLREGRAPSVGPIEFFI